jgi:hypothetical protein
MNGLLNKFTRSFSKYDLYFIPHTSEQYDSVDLTSELNRAEVMTCEVLDFTTKYHRVQICSFNVSLIEEN